MTVLGYERTSLMPTTTSAFHPKADVADAMINVRF